MEVEHRGKADKPVLLIIAGTYNLNFGQYYDNQTSEDYRGCEPLVLCRGITQLQGEMRGQQTFRFKEAIVGVFRPGTENVELKVNLKPQVPQKIGGRISSRWYIRQSGIPG